MIKTDDLPIENLVTHREICLGETIDIELSLFGSYEIPNPGIKDISFTPNYMGIQMILDLKLNDILVNKRLDTVYDYLIKNLALEG